MRCWYTIDIKSEKDILCPKCGSRLVIRTGRYGRFLGCTNDPQCKFTFNETN